MIRKVIIVKEKKLLILPYIFLLFLVVVFSTVYVFSKRDTKDSEKTSTAGVLQTYTYSFEENPLESGAWVRVASDTRFRWSSRGGRHNKAVLAIDGSSQDQRVRLETASGISVQPGERYRVKGWVRQEMSPTGIVSLGVKWTDGKNVLGEQLSPGVWSEEWTLTEMVVTVPKGATEMYIQCRADGMTGKAFFDGVVVEKLAKNGVWVSANVGGDQKQFGPDEIPALSILLENPVSSSRDIQVQIRVEDYADREIYTVTRQVQLSPTGKREIDIDFDALLGKQGYYNIYVDTVESGEKLGGLREELIVFPKDNVAGSEWLLDNPVAVNVYVWSEASHYGTSEEEIRAYVGKLRQMGVQTLRFWIRTGYERWISHQVDFMRIAKEHDMEILLVVGLMTAAAENARETAEWDGISFYFEFLEDLLPKYEGLVDVVEIWNEPFPTPFYFEVLRGGYNVVKALDPDLRVIHAGFYSWHRGESKYPEKEKLEYFAHGTAFNDLASLNHYYTEGYNHHEYYPEAPERPYINDINAYRGILDDYGVGSYGESVWQTETSWEAAVQKPYPGYQGHNDMKMFTYRQQADYAVRLLLIGRSESYRDLDIRHFWYFVHNIYDFRYVSWYTTGLLERTGLPKPSYLMVTNMVNTIANSKYVGRLDISRKVLGVGVGTDETVWSLVFRNGKEPIIAIWSARGEKNVDLHVGSSKVVIVDPMGNRQQVDTKNNTLTLTISESPIYVLGGGEEVLWQALASQLKRVNSEGLELLKANTGLHKEFSEIAKLSEAAVKDRSLEQLNTAVNRVYAFVDDMLDQVQAGLIDIQAACVYLNTLRTADTLEEAIMLAGTVEDVEGLEQRLADAHFQQEALDKKLDPFVGTSKAKMLMRLSERRLEQATRDLGLGRHDDVSMLLKQTARLHAIVKSLLELEIKYKLDVWMKADEYLTRTGIGNSNTVKITLCNESKESVVVRLDLRSPAGISVKTDKTEVLLSPESVTEISVSITVEKRMSGRQEIRIMGMVGDQPIAPIAIGVEQS